MQRWYKDRIGGMFTANAEALADFALARPSAGMAEVGFTCEGDRTGAPSWLEGGKVGGADLVEGWSKNARFFGGAPKQVFIGMVATMIGAPSAPYLHVRGIDRLYSPLCTKAYSKEKTFARANALQLGAATQFRAWINDSDRWKQNCIVCPETNDFYMYDHEYAAPQGETSPKIMRFISEVTLLRGVDGICAEMRDGAVAMAERIRQTTVEQLRDVAAACNAVGLSGTDALVAGLARRAHMFERPNGEKYMQKPTRLPLHILNPLQAKYS